MQPIADDPQRRAVRRFLEAVTADGFSMAEQTAAFLKAQGYQTPRRRSVPCDPVSSPDGPSVARAKRFLLNLAAALWIATWERAGLRDDLPAELPNSSDAFRMLVPPEVPAAAEDPPATAELSEQVFRIWLEHFSHSSRTTLRADVLLPLAAVSQESLLEVLADLLWHHRHLTEPKEPA